MVDQPQLEKSACDGVLRPKGCGYRPPNGSISHLYTGNNGSGTEGRHVMDLNAHGFGEGDHEYNYAALLARYGPNFHGTDETKPRFLALDFESLFGIGSNYLTKLACENKFGTRDTLSCYPTLEELHDYFAVNPGEAAAALGSGGANVGGSKPGQPAITSLTSPAPGRVEVTWQTRPGHTKFRIEGTSSTDGFAADVGGEERTVAITAVRSGAYDVAVTAYIGDTAGKPSLPKPVTVAASGVEPPAPVDTPVVEPPPPPPPPLDGPPASAVAPLSADAQETMKVLFKRHDAAKSPGLNARLVRFDNELRMRGLLP